MLTATLSLALAFAGPVTWEAPAGCPDQSALEGRLDTLLDRDVTELGVDFDVTVVKAEPGFSAQIEVSSDQSSQTRDLRSQRCETLLEAVAVVIALTVEEEALAWQASETPIEPIAPIAPEPRPQPPPQPPPQPQPSDGPPSTNPDPSAPVVSTWVEGGLAVGPLPEPTGLVGVRLRGGHGRWRLGLSANYGIVRAVRYDEPSDVGGRFQSVSGAAEGCFAVAAARRVGVPLCGGVRAGALIAQGIGLPEVNRPTRGFVELEAGPDLTVLPGSRVLLVFALRARLALLRPRFGTEPYGTLFVAPLVGLSLSAGLGFRIR